MLAKGSGKAEYAIMSFGGFLGIGEKYHPLPWDVLTYSPEHDGYVVESWLAADDSGGRTPWRRAPRLANLFGEQGLFLLRRIRDDV